MTRMAMVECWGPIAAYLRTQSSSLQLGLRVVGHLSLADFHVKSRVNSRMWLCRRCR